MFLRTGLAQHCKRSQALCRYLAQQADDGTNIYIDRSGLIQWKDSAASSPGAEQVQKEPETPLAKHLKALIQYRGGPITVAEYASECLTNEQHGYYTQRKVFGAQGDFITSPEVSQMFGELLGVWCVLAWQQMGSPKALHLAELGPGRGTLMKDLLRSTGVFPDFQAALQTHLVEVSDGMRRQQWAALQCAGEAPASPDQGAAAVGTPDQVVRWHRSLDSLPQDAPLLVLAHEFFDSLPAHLFRKAKGSWREVLVDEETEGTQAQHLRFVISPGVTPGSQLLLPRRMAGAELGDSIEICGQGMVTMGSLAERVAAQGGAVLAIDYGQPGPYASSFQAIRGHQPVHPLSQPGESDVSFRVDFRALRQAAEDKGAAAWGPISQADLLQNLGIGSRLEALVSACSDPTEQDRLYSGAVRLVAPSSSQGQPSSPEAADEAADGEAAQSFAPEEGFGTAFMCMAVTPKDQAAPFPFQ